MTKRTEIPDPRCALVTGGVRGIGRAVAEELHASGMKVAVCDLDESGLDEVRDSFGDPERFVAVSCDICDSDQVDGMLAEIAGGLGPVDILVNNAGVLATEKLVDTTDEVLDRVLAVNIGGTFRVSRAVLPGMVSRGWGRIISMASITPIRGEARTTAYAASKGAVIGLTKSLSREVARHGVTVNAIAPGYVLTDMNSEVFRGRVGESIKAQITLGTFGTPDDVSAMAAFLASDRAGYVTGQVLVVDGGVV